MKSSGAHWERFLPPALVTLTFAITYLYLYFGALPLFRDNDTPWHLMAGSLILETGDIPATDPWAFTSGAQPWYIISWMWDVAIELVRQAFDLYGVFIFAVAVTASVAALMAYGLGRREGVGSDALILTLFLAGLSFIEFAAARPQLVGYLCVLVTHMLLHGSRASDGRGLWPLPLLMVLWVNNHGSFIAGLTLLGAYGLEALATKRFVWFRRLFIIGLLCLPALLLNPYGIHMYDAVMRTLDSAITRYISEWMPFVFSNSLGISIWFLVFVLMGSARDGSVPLADRIISIAWFLAMLLSVRNAAICILVSAPMMAISLQRFVEQMDAVRTVRPDVGLALARPGMRLRMGLGALAAVVVSACLVGTLRGEAALYPEKDPAGAMAWLKANAMGRNVLNFYDYGGRIIYETDAGVRVFADGRAGTAHSEEVINDYLRFLWLKPGWEEVLAKYPVEMIVVNNESFFARAYANGQYRAAWKEMYSDEVASIYARRK